ncbi:MAG: hypothetical protein AUK44_07405 [Porphyromonadaceae bacterium CG2_30_38_12]|nr:MAG: hypothetical protein AUK44_07405 [Porphyromonadaceae bacterium CG2_30_38_12]
MEITSNTYSRIKLNGEIIQASDLELLKSRLKSQDSWQKAIFDFLSDWFDSCADIAVQSSGSTGKPKLIRLSKMAMIKSALLTNSFFELTETKTALLCVPATYIAGKMMLVRALVGGFNLLATQPEANPFVNLQHDIDFVAITPYQLAISLETMVQQKIKQVLVGGAPISRELELKLQAHASVFYESYGMTETCSHIALRALNGTQPQRYFKTLPSIRVRTNDSDCLCIEAPHLASTEIVTNDVVELISAYEFRLLGRLDNVINSGGIKIHPEEIERRLAGKIPYNFYIGSKADVLLGQQVVLFVEKENLDKPSEHSLINTLKETLTKYEIPKQICYRATFEYTANKKLKREH